MDMLLIAALGNWRDMNKVIGAFNEQQIKLMLDYEMEHKRRIIMVTRLHARFSAMRAKRERDELVKMLDTDRHYGVTK